MAILSQAAWSKRKDRGDWTYQRYKRYATKQAAAGAARRNAPIDPFAPMSEAQIANMARQQVSAAFQPQIANIDKSFETARKNSAGWIGGLTAGLQDRLKPLGDEIRDIYAAARTQQGGIDAGLVGAANQQSAQTTGGVENQLNAAGIPSAAAGNLPALAAGGGGMLQALGASTASRLNAQGAAAETYGRTWPNIATLAGTQTARMANSEITQGKNKALGDLQALIPGQTADFLQTLRDNELSKAVARKGFEVDEKKLTAASAPAAPDYGWSTGPASQQYVVDPTTGQLSLNPNYKPGSAGKPGKISQTGITNTRKAAQALHDTMMTAFKGGDLGLTPMPANKRAALLTANRQKVKLQVIADLASYYPGQTKAWINRQAAAILAATGWPNVSAEVLGAPSNAPSTGTPAAAPTVQRGSPGAVTQAAPPDVIARNPTVQANAAASTKAAAATTAARTARETRGQRAAVAYVREARASAMNLPANQRPPWLSVKKSVIALLQRTMPGHPYKRIIALANEVMTEYPSRYGG